MATTTMSSLGYRDILVREGIHPPITMIVNSAGVYPGHCLTATGETFPDVSVADKIADNVVGIAGLLENQDIDTVYATDDEIPVYFTGHGAIVKVFLAGDDGGVVIGDIMVCQTVETFGHVEPLHRALKDFVDAAGEGASVLASQITHVFSLVGRAMETVASLADGTPLKIILSI